MAPISRKHTTRSVLWAQQTWEDWILSLTNEKNHVRTSSNDQHCKNQNQLNSPKRRWGSKNTVVSENTEPLCFLYRQQTWLVEPRPTVAATRWRQRQFKPTVSSDKVFDSRFEEEMKFGDKESEMRFDMTANFTEGYHPSVRTRIPSVHKCFISYWHYRWINPLVTKKKNSYRHYWWIILR